MDEITRETRLESYLTRPENRKAAVMAYILYHAPCTARQIMRGLNLPEPNDEKHICPLQLTVIRRAVNLWTNPGDIVLSPFDGIGSEPYVALENGRRAIAVELKQSYYNQMVANCKAVVANEQLSLI